MLWRRWELVGLDVFLIGVGATIALAGAAVLLSLGAIAQIFASDARGLRDAVVGLFVGLIVLMPIGLVAAATALLPAVSVVTTSPALLRNERGILREGEGVKVGGGDLAAYPDLLPLELEIPLEDAFAIVEEQVAERGWRVLERRLPSPSGAPGRIRAVARTPVLGFLDDVVVVVAEDRELTRIDALSASREGQHDLGTNARRLSSLLGDIELNAIN